MLETFSQMRARESVGAAKPGNKGQL